ncbi:hypothetical protein ACFE04_025278 [Oxalis oulophora]
MACFSSLCLRFQVKRKSIGYHDQKQDDNKPCEAEKVDNDRSSSTSVAKRYSWDEIQILTVNFSKLIGSGGFSNVYLGRLSKKSYSAVKIHCDGERLHRVFRQELDILLRLQHDHIVKLLGYCDNQEEGALVFEYVPNRDLHEKLHSKEETAKVLPWRKRMTIAYQLAQAIEYLHEKCDLQIIHGDIKPSNILLDDKLNCKLCDFGSAKIGFSSMVVPSSSPTCSPHFTGNRHMMMIGSPGYTDPYQLRSGVASKKSDVYSYGVLLLELVMGMEAFNPEQGQVLRVVAEPMLKDIWNCESSKVKEMVDTRLGDEVDIEEARAMLSISAMCLRQSPTLRPSATRILQLMEDKIPCIGSSSSHK